MILKPIIPPVILVIALALAVIGALYCIFNKRYRRSRNFIRICIFIAVIVALFRPISLTVLAVWPPKTNPSENASRWRETI